MLEDAYPDKVAGIAGFRLGLGGRLTLLLGLVVGGLSAQTRHTADEQYLFDAVGTARSSAGLTALSWNDSLSHAAADHAERMRKEDSLSHQFEEEADLPERVAATGLRFSFISENVGVSDTAIELQTAWMDSPDHRENILDPKITMVGIAVREHAGALWAVQDFAQLAEMSLEAQERQVETLLRAAGLRKVTSTAAARATCRVSTGYAGNRPAFVLRFTSTDLTHLPAQLAVRLTQDAFSEAAVGACEPAQNTFTTYSIAVVLYR